MPALEVMDMHDDAVVWTTAGVDGRGEPKVSPGREIKVRWVNVSTVFPNNLDPTDAQQYDVTLAVSEDFPDVSLFFQGTLAAWADAETTTNAVLYQLKRTSKAKDIKGNVTRREASLIRYKDRLPTIV